MKNSYQTQILFSKRIPNTNAATSCDLLKFKKRKILKNTLRYMDMSLAKIACNKRHNNRQKDHFIQIDQNHNTEMLLRSCFKNAQLYMILQMLKDKENVSIFFSRCRPYSTKEEKIAARLLKNKRAETFIASNRMYCVKNGPRKNSGVSQNFSDPSTKTERQFLLTRVMKCFTI
jgi:hypothetical protein